MGFFNKKKKDYVDLTKGVPRKKFSGRKKRLSKKGSNEILDLTKNSNEVSNYSAQNSSETESQENTGGVFGGFFAQNTQPSNSDSESNPYMQEPTEKKQKLVKRLTKMTEQIEDLSNEVYRLQQRIEVLERKTDSGRF